MTITNSKPKLAIRMLARYEGTAWTKLSQKKAIELIQGTDSEPEWANERVEIAIAYILDDARPRRLSHVTSSTWQFDHRGMVDDQKAMEEILQKLEEPSTWTERSDSQIAANDLLAICALLKVMPPV